MTEKHRYNLERWKLLIQEQKNSGMKIMDWCNTNGYTKDAYYYWLNRVRKETLPTALSQLQTPDVSQVPVVTQQSFVDVTPVPKASDMKENEPFRGMPSAIIRKNGLEICMFSTVSPELVRLILETMKNA